MGNSHQSPQQEQALCVKCGLCCDGTLFDHAFLEKGEKPHIPSLMRERHFKTKNQDAFKLPCPYFDKKCTIYDQKKAQVCTSFRCELLARFSQTKIDSVKALVLIEKAKTLRAEVFELYKRYTKKEITPSFKELRKEIFLEKERQDKGEKDNIFNLLYFKTNVLELFLIKHFKSDRAYKALFKD